MSKFGEYLKSVGETKENIMGSDSSEYVPFLINRSMSYFPDTLWYTVAINRHGGMIPKEIQYMYYLESLPKRKRFSRWAKKKEDKMVKPIMEMYLCSEKKAWEYINLLTEDQKSDIMKEYKIIEDSL